MRKKLFPALERRDLAARMVRTLLVRCGVTLGVLVFLIGCAGERSQAILDLVLLQALMAAEYGASNVIVELDGSTLGVTLVQPSAGSLGRDRGAELAQEVAEFVCLNYGSMHFMDRVEVAFETRLPGFVIGPTVSVAFEKGELECGGREFTPEAN